MDADVFKPDAALLRLLPTPAVRFHGAGTFAARDAADRFARAAGFTIGQSCAGQPTCLMFGDYDWVAKWKNLRPAERTGCHAVMSGDQRNGPLMIKLTEACPAEGRKAFVETASELEGIS